MQYLRLLLFFLCFTVLAAGAEESLLDSATQVAPRYPEEETLEAYRQDKDYDYHSEYSRSFDLIAWIKRKIGGWLFDNSGSYDFWFEVFKWIFIIGGPAALIYWLFRNEWRRIFFHSRASSGLRGQFIDMEADLEHFDGRLQRALETQDYREAIRLYYVRALKELHESGALTYRIDKTNRDYLDELKGARGFKPFMTLTFYFEYAFYGNFPIRAEAFEQAQDAYNELSPLWKERRPA